MGGIETSEVMKTAKALLEKLFTEVKMPESHGLQHCLTVLGHMDKAIANAEDSIRPLLTKGLRSLTRSASPLRKGAV